jgi:pyruvate formate lyase activating enzyme
MGCVSACPTGAQFVEDGIHKFRRDKCVACGKCVDVCLPKALTIFGIRATAKELIPELLFDRQFYEQTGGGVTISGGEPMAQPEFLCELLSLLRAEGIHTAVDTSLAVPEEVLKKVIKHTDMFLCDIKAVDSDLHKRLTGLPSEPIISNLELLDSMNVPVEIRFPLIPGCNDGEAQKIAELISGLHNVKAVIVLAYHDLGRGKYIALDKEYSVAEIMSPSHQMVRDVQEIMNSVITI